MPANLKFESRKGILTCTSEQAFSFLSDLRRLAMVVPEGYIEKWEASEDECSFYVPPAGTVQLKITGKVPFSVIEYSGTALKDNEFNIVLSFSDIPAGKSEVKALLTATVNPFLKMMITGPAEKFMEILVSEMEKFTGWKK